MKYGPESTKTVPVQEVRESKTIYVAPSRRHALVIAMGKKKTPFCNNLTGNRGKKHPWPKGFPETREAFNNRTKLNDLHVTQKRFDQIVNLFCLCDEMIIPSRNRPYHATKGYRVVSEARL